MSGNRDQIDTMQFKAVLRLQQRQHSLCQEMHSLLEHKRLIMAWTFAAAAVAAVATTTPKANNRL